MVANIIIVLVLLSAYYAYINHNREFTATASAIQQIWSGTCRLSCRQSQYSEYSGLSGLVPDQTVPGCMAHNAGFGCVCESCPCELVENVLRTCSPATNIYTRSIEFLSDCYYDLVKTLIDLYSYLGQMMRSEVASERQAQYISLNQLNSGANINFISKNNGSERDKSAKNNEKPSKSINFKKKPDFYDTNNEATSSRAAESIAMNLEMSEAVIPARGSLESGQVLSNCSKCSEKGKICIVTCPGEKRE